MTDIITFSYNDAEGPDTFPSHLEGNKNRTNSQNVLEGTIYCCAPRIFEQAQEWNEEPSKEFGRILIHGLLHLLNYEDTSPELKEEMRRKEDQHLADIYN